MLISLPLTLVCPECSWKTTVLPCCDSRPTVLPPPTCCPACHDLPLGYREATNRPADVLFLGEQCRAEFNARFPEIVAYARDGGIPPCYRGMSIVWLPGDQVAVGDWFTLQ